MSFSESSADDAEIIFKLVSEDGTSQDLSNEYLLCVEVSFFFLCIFSFLYFMIIWQFC